MKSNLESESSQQSNDGSAKPADWLKMAAVAAASAAMTGLAAAWFYRKTLARMREAAEEAPRSGFSQPAETDDSDEL